ncbi:hypothetical protein [Pseudomonas sp. NBRC 111139]|uniref:Uncharacterized protein n=1 Tax=Pseudomonas caricapapayae TaxID=46678 RepID=A0ACC7LUY6_9PSED|nr:hypothetical protein [Pseudomonas sp. NBRC 111139]
MDKSKQAVLQEMQEYLQKQLPTATREASHRMAVSYWGASAGWKKVSSAKRRPSGEFPEQLLEVAKTDPAAWDAAKILVVNLLDLGEPMSRQLAGFAAAVLRGEWKRPGGNANSWGNLSRDLPLCLAIHSLLAAGFARTESREVEPTAIEAVAKIASELGHKVKADMLEKIWMRHRDHVERVVKDGPHYYRDAPGTLLLKPSPPRRRQGKK